MMGQMIEVQEFADWFHEQPHPFKVCIAGNHDFILDPEFLDSIGGDMQDVLRARELLSNKSFYYLEDQEITLLGLRIYGTPWSPTFFHWGFMKDRGHDLKQMFLIGLILFQNV